MRLYEGTIKSFKEDVLKNVIADKVAEKYRESFGRNVGESEYRSWRESLNFLNNALSTSGLTNNKILLEYRLPYSERRIDVLLFGKTTEDEESIVLMELKQWSNQNVADSENEGNIIVNFGKFKKELPHPSLQVEGYKWDLVDFVKEFEEKPTIELSSIAYCHNYSKKGEATLYLPKFDKWLNEYRVFSKEEAEELGGYLKKRLIKSPGLEVFNRFVNSDIRPSKKLLDHVGEMINKQQVFHLIDDQIAAYNTIMHKANKLSKLKSKSVIIVKGGPGTGKSVIALEVMAELLRKGQDVWHATGSSAFTNTLRKLLGVRASKKFKFFNSFMQHTDNAIEVLICDEAHRIRKTSENMYTPSSKRTGDPQIEELIKASKLSIFFIDEHQVVRPTEIGSVDLIKSTAKKFGVKEGDIAEFELSIQFRCGGSEAFLQWVENVLGIEKSEKDILTKLDKMEFKIVDSPEELKKIIDKKNKEKKNSARIVAGFCWPWSKPKADGSLVNDVKIGNFEMPWEKKDDFWKWATHDSGMGQVGTVYTSQGFEFDYIGVIFGEDLVYNPKKQEWEAKPENSKDTMAKRGNVDFAKHLKNVYRVLMSRAHKGVYVYFVDKDTENFFRERVKN